MIGIRSEQRSSLEKAQSGWQWLVLSAAALLCLTSYSSSARAALVVSAPDIAAAPGTIGYFDLSLSNTNLPGGDSFDVAAFNYTLSLSPILGVQFTDANTSSANYIFDGTGFVDDTIVLLSFDTFPNTTFTAGDIMLDLPGFVSVDPGETFTLGRVFFEISDLAALGAMFTLNFSDISLSDQTATPVAASADNGSITIVAPQATVPEPSTLCLFGLSTAMLMAIRRRRCAPRPAINFVRIVDSP